MARENLCAKPNRMEDATSKVPGLGAQEASRQP